jgi:ZIP family zinc transporter
MKLFVKFCFAANATQYASIESSLHEPTSETVMLDFHPVAIAFMAGLFTWFLTLMGASAVFFLKNPSRKLHDTMLGFAAGVMMAASFFSLLGPAVEFAEKNGSMPWLHVVPGFLAGGLTLWIIDRLVPHLHIGLSEQFAEGPKTKLQKSSLLLLAITIHNIPEGLAVGVAIGSLGSSFSAEALTGALAVAVGIGIQNIPEGFAVSSPLSMAGLSKKRAFFWGQLSGAVEPLAAVAGAIAVGFFASALPFALSFAAGAMIFVVVEELIPQAQCEGNSDNATLGFLFGFALMMLLDVALG